MSVYCVFPTEKSGRSFNGSVKGTHQGIDFTYPSGTTVRSKNKLLSWFNKKKGIVNTFLFALKDHRKHAYDAILITTYSPFVVLMSKLLSKVMNCPLILEKGEYPRFVRNPNTSFLSGLICQKFTLRLYDGFLVMTYALVDYFENCCSLNKPVTLLPLCVDTKRFSSFDKVHPEKHIAYCGSLDFTKDGVNVLVEAFSDIAETSPDWNLSIYGGGESQVQKVKQQVSDLGLHGRVTMTGWLENHKIPSLLLKASILVLPRPDSIQAKGGFPTKLGEYLAAGRTVITTSVGEIPNYLTDGYHAFIVPPSDRRALAEKIQYAIENPRKARQVAEQGRQMATSQFNYLNISKQIIDFLGPLQTNNKIKQSAQH